MEKKIGRIRSILWGIVFVIFGILIGLDFFNIINIFFDGWWTLLIIIPSAIDLIKPGKKILNIIFIIIGIVLLFCCLNIFSFTVVLKLLIPIIFIIVGIIIMFNKK